MSSKAFFKAINNHEVIICDYELDEMKKVFQRKFEDKIVNLIWKYWVKRIIYVIYIRYKFSL